MVLVKVVGRGKISTVPLMIGGTLFTSSVSSILNVVLYYQSMSGGNAMVIAEIQSLQAGSFQSITSPLLLLCFAIPALLPLAILMPLAGRLNILAFGDEQAQLMGVSTGGERLVFILLSTVMTAAVVAFCGAISFVGLIVPHVARYLVGSDFRKLLPASAFCGGIFLLLAFDLSYLLSGFVDAGAIVNVGGGIVFMLYMTKKRRGGFGRA
jgi:iron complex transport system permease protein